MNTNTLLNALGLPDGSRVDQRVPKKMLAEHGASTASDKRMVLEGIEEVLWLATLKPSTIGVPAYRDNVREYLEIPVVKVALRPSAHVVRLSELIHRAMPYPVFLIANDGDRLEVSLAHKRWSQGESGATVVDGDLAVADFSEGDDGGVGQAMALLHQPRTHLFAMYQGWMDVLVAVLAARVTGVFAPPISVEQSAARREALRECAGLDAEVARLKAAAEKEKQIARQVALNLELKRVEQRRSIVRQRI